MKRSINKEGEETLSVSNDVDKSVYVCTRWFSGEITQIHAKKKKSALCASSSMSQEIY